MHNITNGKMPWWHFFWPTNIESTQELKSDVHELAQQMENDANRWTETSQHAVKLEEGFEEIKQSFKKDYEKIRKELREAKEGLRVDAPANTVLPRNLR